MHRLGVKSVTCIEGHIEHFDLINWHMTVQLSVRMDRMRNIVAV